MSARTHLDSYTPRPKWVRYAAGYLALLLGAVLCRVRVNGRQNIPNTGPYIVACNHFSDMDPAFVLYALRRPVIFMAASDQRISWCYQWAAWLYGFIPTNRNRLAPSTIKRARDALFNEDILGIFPEGTTIGTALREAKRGIVYLATITSVPILPMGVSGLNDAWTNWFRGTKPQVLINIGKPFHLANQIPGDTKKQIDEFGHYIMCRIADLLPDINHGKFHHSKVGAVY